MSYALDRLGWLQFEQLCTRVVELEGFVAPGAWTGAADTCRFAVSEAPIGPPLAPSELPAPVLIQCAWIRPGSSGDTPIAAAERLADEHRDELDASNSYLLMCNAKVRGGVPVAPGGELPPIEVVGRHQLEARIDARPELRLRMPSLLGLTVSDRLIDPAVAEASTLERRAADELAGVFVPTRVHARAVRVLGDHGFLVLAGPPEMGKTAIARMIALAKMTCGWQAHECLTPDAVWRAYDPGAAQVFIADDAFGSTEYRADAAERWARAIERLLRSMDERHWLIWTSRPAPLHAAFARLHRERGAERFPSPAHVLVDASDLDVVEKALILFRHAKAAALAGHVNRQLQRRGDEIVANPHFTPERIRRLIAHLQIHDDHVPAAVAAELDTATEAMASSFATLGQEHRDLLIALLDTPPGPVSERDLVGAVRRHHEGPLSKAPAELVDRLADHFLRVHA